MDKGTSYYSTEILVLTDPITAHKTFLDRVWWGGGFPWYLPMPSSGIVQALKDEAGTGGIRQVPGFIHEEILSAEMGKFIEYTLKRKVVLPMSYHRGRINFYPAGPDCTRVVWEVSFTPFPIVGLIVMPIMLSTFDFFFLPELKRACEKAYQPRKGTMTWGVILIAIVKLILVGYVLFMISRAIRIPFTKPQVPGEEYLAHQAMNRADTPELTQLLKDETYLVIGGTGFTGSALVEELRQRGVKKIKVLGRGVPPKPEYPYPNGGSYPVQGVEYIKGSMTDKEALKQAMQGTTIVFQTAVTYGFPSFGSQRGEKETEEVNVGGMKNVYETAVHSKSVKQIIYTSSCDTTFTTGPLRHVNETHPYVETFQSSLTYAEGERAVGDNYARTKILAEKFILENDGKHGIRTASIRPNGIFGPGEFSAFKRAIDPAYIMGFFPFYFDETQETDWTCVHNLVYAHLLAAAKLKTSPEDVGGKAYYITADEISNSAAAQIFAPAVEAAAGPARLWFKIPPWVLIETGRALESLEKFVFEKTGWAIPLPMTHKEALKTLTTHTHDNSRAKKDLGYTPLMSTAQCQKYTAEETARRYWVR